MDAAYLSTPSAALKHFDVTEQNGLSTSQVQASLQKHGPNSIEEEPATPLWKLILEQFKDQLVLILLASAFISFVLALFEDGEGWTAFVDPLVVSAERRQIQEMPPADESSRSSPSSS
jgi:Ca2+ transporting ATPase